MAWSCCRRELLDRPLVWNQQHLLHALCGYEQLYNTRRPHPGIANAPVLGGLINDYAPTAA